MALEDVRSFVGHVRAVGFTLVLASVVLAIAAHEGNAENGDTISRQFEFVRQTAERWQEWSVVLAGEQEKWMATNEKNWRDPAELSSSRWLHLEGGIVQGWDPEEWIEIAMSSTMYAGGCELASFSREWSPSYRSSEPGLCGSGPLESLSDLTLFWQSAGRVSTSLFEVQGAQLSLVRDGAVVTLLDSSDAPPIASSGGEGVRHLRASLDCPPDVRRAYLSSSLPRMLAAPTRRSDPSPEIACVELGEDWIVIPVLSRFFSAGLDVRNWLRSEYGSGLYWRRSPTESPASDLFSELYAYFPENLSSPFSELAATLQARSSSQQEPVQIVGITMNPGALRSYGSLVVISLQLVLWLHLKALRGCNIDEVSVAWIGSYPFWQARIAAFVSYCMIPAVSCIYATIAVDYSDVSVLFVLLSLVLASFVCLNLSHVSKADVPESDELGTDDGHVR